MRRDLVDTPRGDLAIMRIVPGYRFVGKYTNREIIGVDLADIKSDILAEIQAKLLVANRFAVLFDAAEPGIVCSLGPEDVLCFGNTRRDACAHRRRINLDAEHIAASVR